MEPPQVAQSIPAWLSLFKVTSATRPRRRICLGWTSIWRMSCSIMTYWSWGTLRMMLLVGTSGTTTVPIIPARSGRAAFARVSTWVSWVATVVASAFWSL
ncbi:MAG: hypothetical protein BWY88_01145 [Synergistetes bacterium ADurb.Bin520]|nr:MAG: hypothetical protein BWY88_01145 [Synergistetes bacterium ADurb.Bin520]